MKVIVALLLFDEAVRQFDFFGANGKRSYLFRPKNRYYSCSCSRLSLEQEDLTDVRHDIGGFELF
jgi:hypothetical protein